MVSRLYCPVELGFKRISYVLNRIADDVVGDYDVPFLTKPMDSFQCLRTHHGIP